MPITMEEVSAELTGVKVAFEDLKELVTKGEGETKKVGEIKAETKEKLDKVEVTLSGHEDKYNELMKGFGKAAEERKSANERIEELETALSRPLQSNEAGLAAMQKEERSQLKSNFFRYCMKTMGHSQSAYLTLEVTDEERTAFATIKEIMLQKALNVGTDTAGGFLVPEDYRAEMIKTITEFSPLRGLARLATTARDSVKWPVRTGQFSAVWVSEQGSRSETTGLTFGLEDIPVHEVYALVDISEQMLEDSAFNMESFLNEEAAEQFAVAEGLAFISGSGVGKPEGITDSAAGLSAVNSGGATALTADGLIALFYALKDSYARRSTWIMKRATVAVIRRFKESTSEQYLWQPGLQAGQPGMILGQPFAESIDMTGPTSGDTFDASAKPIALGDWRRCYIIVDRISMSLLRDPFTQATSGNVRFLFRKRVGGHVIQAEAAVLQNVAA